MLEVGSIGVRDPKGGIVPVPTPEGVTDTVFRNVIGAVYTHFRRTAKVPSIADLGKAYPNLPKQQIALAYQSDSFLEALDRRGIAYGTNRGFTTEQQMVLLKFADPTDRRSIGGKLKDMGVPRAKYQAWLKDAAFAEAINAAAESVLTEAVAPTLVQIAAKAEAGEDVAMKLLLEMTGRWNPNAQSLEDARVVVMTVLESVMKHASPEVREQILADVSLVAGTLGAISPPQ